MNLSMLYITHDLSSAWAIADSVAVMYLGKLVEYGPKKGFSTTHATPTLELYFKPYLR